jgi:adenylate kinase family enzyme
MEGGAMINPHGIIVFGASGSGTTTLARELVTGWHGFEGLRLP